MAFWGGPPRRRMRGMLLCTLALAAFCLFTGLRPSLWTIGAGAFGMALWLTLVNGIYTTIVQVKVAQRFHGRVFAVNTLIAWSTLPIGWGLVAPYGARLFNPLMVRGGALSGTFGRVLGVGPGRGIGLMYLLFAVAMALLVLIALRTPVACPVRRAGAGRGARRPDRVRGTSTAAHVGGRTRAPPRPAGAAMTTVPRPARRSCRGRTRPDRSHRRRGRLRSRSAPGTRVPTPPRTRSCGAGCRPAAGSGHPLFDARGWVDYAVCFAAVLKAAGGGALPRSQPAAELARLLADCGASGLIHDGTAGDDGTAAALSAIALPCALPAARGPGRGGARRRGSPLPIGARSTSRSAPRTWRRSSTPQAPPAAQGRRRHPRQPDLRLRRRRRLFAHSSHLVHAFPIGTNAGQVMLLNALDAHPAVVSPARFTPARFAARDRAVRGRDRLPRPGDGRRAAQRPSRPSSTT